MDTGNHAAKFSIGGFIKANLGEFGFRLPDILKLRFRWGIEL